MARFRLVVIGLLASLWTLPALSQDSRLGPLERGAVVSPVLTIDSDRVFQDSAFGRRVAAEGAARLAALEAENDSIAKALEAEELDLTQRREGMAPDAFRELADAFDKKVQETRAAQNAKNRDLNSFLDQERENFFQAAASVFEQLMREAGAAVILDRRSVFASATAIDITDEAVLLLDETIGDGTQTQE